MVKKAYLAAERIINVKLIHVIVQIIYLLMLDKTI